MEVLHMTVHKHSSPAPFAWTMTESDVLAHRFSVPELLPAFSALTVRSGQAGLALIGGQQLLCLEQDTHILTGDASHSIPEGYRVAAAGGNAQVNYHPEITLFDTRLKSLPQETVLLTSADGGETFAFLSLTFHISDIVLFNRCGAVYQPCGNGDYSEIGLNDASLTEVFSHVLSTVTAVLQKSAMDAQDPSQVRAMLLDNTLGETLRQIADQQLLPLGLTADFVRLKITERSCPYCSRQLSLMDIRRGRCSATEGCGCALHRCPSCDHFVRSDQTKCPGCHSKLLWCGSKGCETFRTVERGRFCPVCRCACYPPRPREFFRNE